MNRYSRKREPAVRRKERVELSESNLVLRLVGVGVAILVAVLAFGNAISGLLQTQTGWQVIEPTNPETGIAGDFVLNYYIGRSNQSATAERKAVSAAYTEALEHAYRVTANSEMEHYVNLYTLNESPNEIFTVDPVLYAAFEVIESSGSRLPYLAPMMEQYSSLFACTFDEEAEKFDPARSEGVAAFADVIASIAADPELVHMELLPDCRMQLTVAPSYLAYAAENGVERFVDLGILRNAFLVDAAAEALEARGLTNGFIASFDGYTRTLCADSLTLNVFDWQGGASRQIGNAEYSGPAALVTCRSFPAVDKDLSNYFTYSDGTVLGPYLNAAGRSSAGADFFAVLKPDSTVAPLAIHAVECFSAGTAPDFGSAIMVRDHLLSQTGTGFAYRE